MYWLIETEEQLKEFESQQYQEVFVEVIPFDNREHPYENEVCAVYIFPLDSQKGFILPTAHSEALSLRLSEIERILNTFKSVYVRDKKEFMHYFLLKAAYNTPPPPNTYIQPTKAHTFFYNKFKTKADINRIIPIVKHYEHCNNIYKAVKPNLTKNVNEFFNTKACLVYNYLEQSGLRIDREKFSSYFYPTDKEYVYTQYNFNTLTRRPSNTFKGVNYAALNKSNKEREAFIPRNDYFIDLDVSAYHPTILSRLVGYDYGDGDIYGVLAQIYKMEREEAKILTLKQINSKALAEWEDAEFFKKVGEYKSEMWEKLQREGVVEVPISKYKFLKSELEDMNPGKLLNYLLQGVEVAMNVKIMWDMFRVLRGKKTKVVLCTYDAWLLDVVDTEGEAVMKDIANIFKKYKLNYTIKKGMNYDFGKEY
jgi:hypothetical protein